MTTKQWRHQNKTGKNKKEQAREQTRLKGRGKRTQSGVYPGRGKGTTTHGHRQRINMWNVTRWFFALLNFSDKAFARMIDLYKQDLLPADAREALEAIEAFSND